MNISTNCPIALIDSGIGGLSLLKSLHQKYIHENYIYLADNLNMPYGTKTNKFLTSRILELINYLYNTFNVKLVILACNTASVSTIKEVAKHSPIKVVGLNINTLITNYDPSNYKIICTKLCAKGYKSLNVLPCKNLASDIEENFFDQAKLKRKIKRVLSKANIEEKNIVLGCTHYELVAKYFKDLFVDKNFILPCNEFVKNFSLELPNTSNSKGDVLMLATLATKSYIDKLWKIFKT